MVPSSPTAFANEFCSRKLSVLRERQPVSAAVEQRARAVLFVLYIGTWRAMYDVCVNKGESIPPAAAMRPRCDEFLLSATGQWSWKELLPEAYANETEMLFREYVAADVLAVSRRMDEMREHMREQLLGL